jgi:DNA-binding CsgD family transcriptional regulator
MQIPHQPPPIKLTPAVVLQPGFSLTETQCKILRGLAEDYTMKDMAAQMGVSFHTIHSHLRTIYKRLGVRGSNAAIAHSLRAGWI